MVAFSVFAVSTPIPKFFTTQITELQYADACIIVVHDPDSLQTALDVFSATYAAMGLKVNTLKTDPDIMQNCAASISPLTHERGAYESCRIL